MKWRPWHRRSGDRPSDLSRPWRKEPRSAAERLLALETKFLLFWAGQERDSVLLRSPAPRSDCSGALRTKPGGGNALAIAYERHARWQTLPGRERRRRPSWRRAWPLGPMEGSNQAGTGTVRWTGGRVKPSWRTAWSVGPMERSNASWRRAWSVGPMEGSNQADAQHRPLDRWKGQTARSLVLVGGRAL
jgi:hypothetical protein